VVLLLPLYPLLTYTSANAVIWQRYSTSYAGGLLVYGGFLLLWLLLLGLPERYMEGILSGLESLKSHRRWHVQFMLTCIFLTLLVLTGMRLWGWGYNWLLWLDVFILGVWLSFLPTFLAWGLKGWPIEPVSPGWLSDWLEQNPHLWLPPFIGVGVLLISNLLGFNAAPRQLMLALGLVPGIIGLLIFWRWPPLGLVTLVIAGLIAPSPTLPSGLNLPVILLIGLIGLQLLATIIRRRPLHLVPSRTVRPLLGLSATAILSFGVGQLPWFTFARPAPLDAQLGGLAIFVLAAAIFLLVAHQVRDLRWLQWLSWVFVALTSLNVANWLLPPVALLTGNLFPDGTVNNAMFWLWLVALTFSQALYNQKLHIGWRLALGGLVIATLYVTAILGNDWKSGYLPPLVCIGVLIAFRSWRTALVIALVGYPLALYVSSQAVATDDYSYSTRVDAFLVMLELIKVNPIIGFGPANYHFYTPLFPIRGYAIQFNSHNQYIDIVAQTGLIGLACFIWFAVEVGWLGWRLRHQVPAGFARAYVYGALGGLAGMIVSGTLVDWFLPFVYNIGLTGFRTSMLAWLFLGGLVSLEQIYRPQAQSEAPKSQITLSKRSQL
jgi:O-antigen ligase